MWSDINALLGSWHVMAEEGGRGSATEYGRSARHDTAARVYRHCWRCSGVAAGCTRAAEGDAGDRVAQPPQRTRAALPGSVYGLLPQGTERSRLRRGTEFGDRIPPGGGPL